MDDHKRERGLCGVEALFSRGGDGGAGADGGRERAGEAVEYVE